MNSRKSFDELLEESAERHGHLCAGQIIGVRMSMLGCRLLGIDDPKAPEQRKKLMVFVEIDRCATDAIESVTGCRMGKRSLKYKDFGINAATFLNLETREAFRIVSTESSREQAREFAPGQSDKKIQQIEGYTNMPDHLLFNVQKVNVRLTEWEMPGPTRRRATCQQCGQVVRDAREVVRGDKMLCRPCAGEGYFTPLETVGQF
ncbi:MAG: FmdE family protein [Desulfosarcinaceae bacterium]